MKSRIPYLISLLVPVLISSRVMAGDMTSISIGYEQTTGNYGLAEETKITTIPLNIKYTKDAWGYKLSIPYISVTGDGSVIPSGSGSGMKRPGGSMGSVIKTESGLGDISGVVSYAILPENSNMYYELAAKVKLGTASEKKNLGTGENDYSVSLYGSYEKKSVKPFLSVGYTVFGDTDSTDFNDVFFVMAGINYQLNAKTLLSVSYDYQQATVDTEDDGEVLSLTAGRKFNKEWSANIYLLDGLSDSVADSGAGFSVTRNFY